MILVSFTITGLRNKLWVIWRAITGKRVTVECEVETVGQPRILAAHYPEWRTEANDEPN